MNSRLEKITENNKTFLIYKIDENDTIDNMSVSMLKSNDILHILPVSFSQVGDEKFLRYDVTSKISLTDAIKYPISKERFLAIFDGIFSGILNLDDYMIPTNTLLLNTDDIYFDEFNEYIYLISFPINVSESTNVDFADFTRSLTNRVQLQANDEFMTGKVLNRLNQTQTFSVGEFHKFIKSIRDNKDSQKKVAVQQSSIQQPISNQGRQPIKSTIKQTNQNGALPVNNVPAQPNAQQKQPATQQKQAPKNQPPIQKAGMNIPGQQGRQMNVPGQQPAKKSAPNQVQTPNTEVDPNEPQISLFYLLQHYNAENAVLYKKQKEAKKSGGGKSKKSNSQNIAVPNQTQQTPQTIYVQQPVTYVEQREPQKRNFGNTTVLNGKNKKKTTVLNGKAAPTQNNQKKATLVRERNNERIVITKIPFKLGASEDGDVDYIIRGNTNISQSHAIIGYEVSEYTIADDHSTNGTYLNGNPLQPEKYMLLNSGNIVRMADEDFRFEIV